MDGWTTDVPDDVLAAVDLVGEGAPAPRGEETTPDATRACGVRLGHPLSFALPPDPTVPDHSGPSELLLCFPFDLEELSDGRRYREAELTVLLNDGLRALSLHPAPGTPIARVEPYDVDVKAFGLGSSRLRWVFRAPGGVGGLRPDGRWAQTLVRLPPGTTEVTGQLRLRAVIERPRLFGMWPGTPVHMPQEVLFRLSTEDAWKTGRHFAGPGNFPGSWALPPYGEADDAEEARWTAGADEELPPGLRRLCLAVDIEKYSARDNADMVRLQRVLLRTLRTACARAGVRWDACGRQASGDGYLLILDPAVDETRVVPDLLAGLAGGLASANSAPAVALSSDGVTGLAPARAKDDSVRPLRMRASLHQGIVHEADSGWAGSAVVALFRVLDCGPLRQALTSNTSDVLAVAFSDSLYQDLVAHGYAGLSPDGFRRVDVHNAAKDFSAVAWIRLGPGV
ncbi:hypothetical protein OG729_03825 [Streptomyces sp. NBC_00210]|uniref:hypothetical protein n=1 Tax=unclassified Streptomyces TaxID=2593676 RepID=UPI00324C4DE6